MHEVVSSTRGAPSRSGVRRRRRPGGRVARVLSASVAVAFLWSLLSASVASAAPWRCDAFGYLFQSPTGAPPGLVQQIDLATGDYRTIGQTPGNVLNAVGYNVLDNYFYAWNTTARTMVRVEDDLTLTTVPSGGFPGGIIGDVDDRGHFWGLSGTGAEIYEIDYAPGSPTYGRTLRTVPLGAAPPGITNGGADWAWIDGYLYMIGNDAVGRGYLVRVDPATGARVNLTPGGFAGPIVGVGAVYADARGYLYGSDNNSGVIYRVDPRTLQIIEVGTATRANSNDGARCASAPIPTITVTKAVDGRVRDADQFTVGIVDPRGRTATSASTAGADTSATTVDWPVSQNATYTITDAMAAGSPTPLGEYTPTIACVDALGTPAAVGGAPGRWTLLVADPTYYACTVTNRASADVAVTKTSSPSPAVPGTDRTYTLRIVNHGPSSAIDARVADSLPAGLTFVSSSPGCSVAGGVVTCAAGDLAPGATAAFTVTARVAADLPAGTLQNTATGTSRTPDPDPGNNRSTDRVPVDPQADVSIDKRALARRAVPGRNLAYELVVVNHGPSVARDVRAVDRLPRNLTFVSASDGCAAADGTVTCATATLAPGATVVHRIVARVASSVTGAIVNSASVESPTRDPDPRNNRDTEEVPTGPEADLSIVKVPSVDRVPVGGQLFYTLVVANDGPSDATGVVVSDTAGAGLTLLSARSSQGRCAVESGRVTCRLGRIAAGGTAQVLVSARADQAGELTNSAAVRGDNPDPNPRNDRDERRVTGDPPPATPAQSADLAIVKTSNRRAAVGAQAIRYRLAVRNLGPGTAAGVQVIDTPSLPVRVVSVRSSVGRCTRTVPIRCDLGTLRSGARATVTVVAQPKAPGALRNSASVTGDVPDADASNNIDGTVTRVRGLLRVRKVASAKRVRAGGTLSYKITVTNASAFALRSVRVCDSLPSGLVFASSAPRSRLSAGRRCWTVRRLGARRSATFTLRVRALRGTSGRKVNVARATAPGARGARSRAATDSAPIQVIAGRVRSGGVTG